MVCTNDIQKVYLKPPTIDEMLSFIDEVGVSYAHFEHYYGIAPGIIKSVKAGFKPLPKKYWPIFFDRIIPTYGALYQFKKPTQKKVSKLVSNKVNKNTTKQDFHGRLSNLKDNE